MPPPVFDVCFAMTGDARRNSRTLRQLRVFESMGLSVCVLASGPPATPGDLPGNATLRVLALPQGGGPPFFWKHHRSVLKTALEVPARVYHASDLFVLPALARAARKRSALLAYDARELYPHVFGTVGKPWASWTWARLERRFARRAQTVFTVNDSIADWMVRRYGIARPTVLFNVPDATSVPITDALREKTGIASGTPIVLYQGALFPHRGLPVLVEAMARVPDAALVLMGDGPLREALRRQIDRLGLGARAHLLEPVLPADLLAVTASADIGAVTLDDACLSYHYALPNKLFEYAMARLPIVASDLPELHAVVEGHGVGFVTPPGDVAALAHALRQLTENPELRAALGARTPHVFETYSPAEASRRLRDAYETLLAD